MPPTLPFQEGAEWEFLIPHSEFLIRDPRVASAIDTARRQNLYSLSA